MFISHRDPKHTLPGIGHRLWRRDTTALSLFLGALSRLQPEQGRGAYRSTNGPTYNWATTEIGYITHVKRTNTVSILSSYNGIFHLTWKHIRIVCVYIYTLRTYNTITNGTLFVACWKHYNQACQQNIIGK